MEQAIALFANNSDERDIRMAKVQQRILGGLPSIVGRCRYLLPYPQLSVELSEKRRNRL